MERCRHVSVPESTRLVINWTSNGRTDGRMDGRTTVCDLDSLRELPLTLLPDQARERFVVQLPRQSRVPPELRSHRSRVDRYFGNSFCRLSQMILAPVAPAFRDLSNKVSLSGKRALVRTQISLEKEYFFFLFFFFFLFSFSRGTTSRFLSNAVCVCSSVALHSRGSDKRE